MSPVYKFSTAGSFATSRTLYKSALAGNTAFDGFFITASTLPSSAFWGNVAYDETNAIWAVATDNSTAIATSPDGVTWTAKTGTSSVNSSLGAGPGFFFTLNYASAVSSYSTNGGATWTSNTVVFDYYYPIGKNATYAVAVTHYGSGIYRTSNGSTWTAYTLPAGGSYPNAVASNGGNSWAAVAGNSTNVSWQSTDAATWTARTLPASNTWNGVVWNGVDKFWAFSAGGVGATSPDGITWTAITTAVGFAGMQHAVLGNKIFVQRDATSIQYSTDNCVTMSYYTLPVTLTNTACWGNQHYTQNAAKNKFVFTDYYNGTVASNKVIVMFT